MKRAITLHEAVALIPDGAVCHIGGFMAVGSPHRLLGALARSGRRGPAGVGSDTGASHIGLNPETQQKMIAGEIEVELVPQGTLVERIRAAGVGLGGVLTRTGVGTRVEDGKQTVEIDGKTYLLERPIHADFALIGAHRCDYVGNLDYSLTAHNFNPIMALAATIVIAEPEEIVPVGVIPPDAVKTPGALVDHVIGRRD